MEIFTITSSVGGYDEGYKEGYQKGKMEIIDNIRAYVFYDLLAGFIFGVVFASLFFINLGG